MGRIKNISGRILNSDHIAWTFLRSAVSSQTASWVDLLISFCLFAWADFTPWMSTALGALAGGIVNCIINYHFTFHAAECSWRAVVVKYAMVWAGSLMLNSFGTQTVYYIISKWQWLIDMGFRPDGFFAAARLVVSLAVSWFWNFLLQRYFVYRPTSFDKKAIAFVYFITPPRKHGNKKESH